MVIVEQTPVINLNHRTEFKQHPKDIHELVGTSSGLENPNVSRIVFPPQRNLRVSTPPRTPGLHVSGLIRSAALKYGLLKAKTRQQQVAQEKEQEFLQTYHASFGGGGTAHKFEEDVPLIVFMGLCWEDRLQQQYKNMCYHVGEFEMDGVYMSPDGVEEHDGIWFVDEIKLTYKSMTTPFEFQALYHMQVKAYCKRLKTNYARFHVLYVNGNYTNIRGPHYRIYDVSYTPQELEGNWDFLMRHRDMLVREGKLEEIVEKPDTPDTEGAQ